MRLFELVASRLRGVHSSPRAANAAALLIRGVLGYTFVGHGAQKLFGAYGGGGIDGTTQFFAFIGLPNAHLMAILVGLVEFFGGLLLLAGFLTVAAGVALIADMVGAIATLTGGHGFFVETSNGGWEINFVIIGLLGAVTLIGAGAWSLDRLVGLYPAKRTDAQRSPAGEPSARGAAVTRQAS